MGLLILLCPVHTRTGFFCAHHYPTLLKNKLGENKTFCPGKCTAVGVAWGEGVKIVDVNAVLCTLTLFYTDYQSFSTVHIFFNLRNRSALSKRYALPGQSCALLSVHIYPMAVHIFYQKVHSFYNSVHNSTKLNLAMHCPNFHYSLFLFSFIYIKKSKVHKKRENKEKMGGWVHRGKNGCKPDLF